MTALQAPPRPTATRGRRMVAPGATIAALAAGTLALYLRDPHAQGSWGICPSAAAGFFCPGCGGLRAVNDLTHGDLGAALSSNLVVTLLLPVVALLLGVWALDRWQGRSRHIPWDRLRPPVIALVTVLLVFAVVRNTGSGAWLAP